VLTYPQQLNEPLDNLNTTALLRAKEYQQLNALLSKIQSDYEKGIISDMYVDRAYNAFFNADPALEAIHNEWVELFPDVYIPYAARGIYNFSRGWAYRGTKFSNKVSKDQFKKLNELNYLAFSDLLTTIKLHKPFTVGFGYVIRISTISPQKELLQQFSKAGLTVDPASYAVRKGIFLSLMPRWGGSIKKTKSFVTDTKKYQKQNKDLEEMNGQLQFVIAKNLKDYKVRTLAVKYLDEAIRLGKNPRYYNERAKVRSSLKQFDLALSDFNRAIELWPQFLDALEGRSYVYRQKKMFKLSFADIDLAVKLAPYDSRILKTRARLLTKQNRYQAAVDDYKRALFYNATDAGIWYSIGWNSYYKLKDYKSAADALERATELKPEIPRYWYTYASVLDKLRDCKIVTALKTYLNLCSDAQATECKANKTQWASTTIQYLATSKTCS